MNLAMNGTPRIESVKPAAALPGGEVAFSGSGFGMRNHARPQVRFGEAEACLILAADKLLIARVPEGAAGGAVRIKMGSVESAPFPSRWARKSPTTSIPSQIPPSMPTEISTSPLAASAAKKFPSRSTKSQPTTP